MNGLLLQKTAMFFLKHLCLEEENQQENQEKEKMLNSFRILYL